MGNPIDRVEDRLRADCPHDQWMTPRELRADRLLGLQTPNAKRVLFGGLGVRVCRRCGVLRWPEELQTIEDVLSTLAREAGSLIPLVGQVSIYCGAGGSTSRSRQQNEHADDGEFHSEGMSLLPRDPRYHFQDVVLPAATQQDLAEALIKVRFHSLIYESWGFNRVDPVGRGVSLDFYGPTGTGKTRTAEALAGELGLPFLCVSAGELESRFMGETPKNIRRAFEAAHDSNALLFFDEAESLFGRRASDVTQGVDHEVNIAKSTLLMELERFEGVLVLASNFQEIYDSAFRRRITHHVRFELPDLAALEALLAMHVVEGIPLDGNRQEILDRLAQVLEAIQPVEDRFSGADILTMVRLALPAAIKENSEAPRVSVHHFERAIDSVLRAKREVGRRGHFLGRKLQETRFSEREPSPVVPEPAPAKDKDN